jgi:transposase
MAKRTFQLSEREIGAFRRQESSSQDSAEVKRLQAVRLYGSGRAVSDIQDVTGCSASSLRRWAGRYRADGLEGLSAHHASSAYNARKLTAEQQADLQQRLHSYRPDQVIVPALRLSQGQFWTVSDLHRVVEQWYGVVYRDRGSYRHLFHACGFSYQHAAGAYKSRPSEADIADFEAELEKK